MKFPPAISLYSTMLDEGLRSAEQEKAISLATFGGAISFRKSIERLFRASPVLVELFQP
jgi:hypothetical protein